MSQVRIDDLGPAARDLAIHLLEKKSKYRNHKITIDGITFDSALEGNRWCELKLLEKAGEISGLKRQVRFSIDIDGVHICNYLADFVYFEGNKRVVEDCKGFRTEVYKLKKKLVEACYRGVVIREVMR